MKIGILTFHRPHNYGAVLQAYALKKFLDKTHYDIEIIDYWPKYHSNNSNFFFIDKSVFKSLNYLGKVKYLKRILFTLIKVLIRNRGFSARRKGFNKFIEKELNLSRQIRFLNPENISGNYDLVIYGSDQIWRKDKGLYPSAYDKTYFGYFLKNTKKKISYAASMGNCNVDKNDRIFLKQALSQLDVISVREKDLQSLMQDLSFNSTLVLDPTLLLNKSEWKKLSSKSRLKLEDHKYIFFYHLNYSVQALKLVEKLGKENNLEIFELKGYFSFGDYGRRFKYQIASPIDFLSLIENASFVISTSFHGAVFSIIYEKQFYALGMEGNSMRVKSLLSSLEIENRYLNVNDQPDFKEAIHYSIVSERLKAERENSANFLLESITIK